MTQQENSDDPTMENEPAMDETNGFTDDVTAEELSPSPATATDPVDGVGDLTQEVEKWKDVAARAQADLDNYRKRIIREKAEAIQYANRSLLEQVLPLIDNFDMGLRAAEMAGDAGALILQGMEMVRKQFDDFLADHGVEKIPSDDVAFDPHLHEAIKHETSDTVPEGHIIFTIRRGYKLKDRILRAANVVVSSGQASKAE